VTEHLLVNQDIKLKIAGTIAIFEIVKMPKMMMMN